MLSVSTRSFLGASETHTGYDSQDSLVVDKQLCLLSKALHLVVLLPISPKPSGRATSNCTALDCRLGSLPTLAAELLQQGPSCWSSPPCPAGRAGLHAAGPAVR